ncbi:MAG: ubiquinol-cytochrome c reductase iron-sulfur subunit [Planctomycetales bacterium]
MSDACDQTGSHDCPHYLQPEAPRRGFVREALAVLIGGIVGLFPLVTGALVFLDPLRKKQGKAGAEQDDEGFIRIATLDGLLVGGAPRRFAVIDDRSDAWNLYPKEPIGAVYLLRPELETVQAFNVTCPHAGCSVDFKADRKVYQCPCHDSSFNIDGSIANEKSPSPRGLDELAVKIKNETEVWVKFQKFKGGTAEKISKA